MKKDQKLKEGIPDCENTYRFLRQNYSFVVSLVLTPFVFLTSVIIYIIKIGKELVSND